MKTKYLELKTHKANNVENDIFFGIGIECEFQIVLDTTSFLGAYSKVHPNTNQPQRFIPIPPCRRTYTRRTDTRRTDTPQNEYDAFNPQSLVRDVKMKRLLKKDKIIPYLEMYDRQVISLSRDPDHRFEVTGKRISGKYELEHSPFKYEVTNTSPKQLINNAILEINSQKTDMLTSAKTIHDEYSEHISLLDYVTSYPYFKENDTIDTIKTDYLLQQPDEDEIDIGSYHINVTLPYKRAIYGAEDKKAQLGKLKTHSNVELDELKKDHINLMKALQLFEVLFLAVFTNVRYNSFDDNHKNFENSYRLIYGWINFLGYNDLNSFYEHPPTEYQNALIDAIMGKLVLEIPENNRPILDIDFRNNGAKFSETFFGFEFRFFDLFPDKYLTEIIHFIFLLAEHIKENEIDLSELTVLKELHTDPIIQFIANIIKEGWDTKIDKGGEDYLVILVNNLFPNDNLFPTGVTLNNFKESNCYDILDFIFSHLKTKYNDRDRFDTTRYMKHVTTLEDLGKLNQFANINRLSYNFFLDMQVKYDEGGLNTKMNAFLTQCNVILQKINRPVKDDWIEQLRPIFKDIFIPRNHHEHEDMDDACYYAIDKFNEVLLQ